MNFNQIVYQIYPLGFCGAPKENDGVQEHRILKVPEFADHLKKLGITQVMFNPVFESDRHGYDTRDFMKIDVRLGTNEDFANVTRTLKENGIGVILDGVFNHVGRGCPMFLDVKEKKWDSPYKDWFYIDFNNTWNEDGFGYADWEGHHELVKLNLGNPEVRDYLFRAVDFWIEQFGIDGLRLDVAYCLDRDFIRALHYHVKSNHPDFLLLGEMIGGDYNSIMADDMVDSVTNYECRKGLFSSMNTGNLFEIGYSLNRQFGPDPWCLYRGKHLLSFVDNHDVDRIASVLNDPQDLKPLYALMYAMPGIPCIYYGSEWGIKGTRTKWSDDDLRPSVDQPEWNDLTDYLKALNEMRLQYPVFTDGNYIQAFTANRQWAFKRCDEHGQLIFAINLDSSPADLHFDTGVKEAVNLLSNETVNLEGGVHLNEKSAAFFYSAY